jgi:hypothetical protein
MTRIARIAIQDADCVARAPGAVTASSGAAQPRAMRRERREYAPDGGGGSHSRRSRLIVTGRFRGRRWTPCNLNPRTSA